MGYINQKEIESFQQSLLSLKKRSVNHFWETHGKRFSMNRNGSAIIPIFIDDMEYYFYCLLQFGYIHSDNVSKIIKDFQGISRIEPLEDKNERLFALTTGSVISIHPNLDKYRNLSSRDFQQLIISHELGHIINQSWKKQSFQFAKELYQNSRVRGILKNMGLDSYDYLKDGFELLDEVITQEIAEEVTYFKKNKKRPRKEYRKDKDIFDYQPYLTNYNLYGEL